MNKAQMSSLQRRHSSHGSLKSNEFQDAQKAEKQLTPNRSILNGSMRNSHNDLVAALNLVGDTKILNSTIITYPTKSMTPSDIESNDLNDKVKFFKKIYNKIILTLF